MPQRITLTKSLQRRPLQSQGDDWNLWHACVESKHYKNIEEVTCDVELEGSREI